MPEASMHEDAHTMFGEYYVRRAREIFSMKGET